MSDSHARWKSSRSARVSLAFLQCMERKIVDAGIKGGGDKPQSKS